MARLVSPETLFNADMLARKLRDRIGTDDTQVVVWCNAKRATITLASWIGYGPSAYEINDVLAVTEATTWIEARAMLDRHGAKVANAAY